MYKFFQAQKISYPPGKLEVWSSFNYVYVNKTNAISQHEQGYKLSKKEQEELIELRMIESE